MSKITLGLVCMAVSLAQTPIEKDIALGRSLAANLERQLTLLEDPVVAEYINRLANNLARNAALEFPVTMKVIDNSDAKAIALPGGFMFLSTGIINRAETEAELAGVMAHEMAHIAARHGARQATPGGSIPLIFMGGWAGMCSRFAGDTVLPAAIRSKARGFEEEADLLGLQCLHEAGYDPSGLIHIFEKLSPGIDLRSVQSKLQEQFTARSEYVVTTSEFVNVKSRVPRPGPVRAITPSLLAKP